MNILYFIFLLCNCMYCCYIEHINASECPICFENKTLYNFCDKHLFCKSCIIDCLKNNCNCPVCRVLCNNKRFFNFNITKIKSELQNMTLHKYTMYFKRWHRQSCLSWNHNFHIRTTRHNNFIFYCEQCHVEQKIKNNIM